MPVMAPRRRVSSPPRRRKDPKDTENLREFLELARIVLVLRREGQDGEGSEYDEIIGA